MRRDLKIYAMLSQSPQGSDDVLSGLMPLFEPIIDKFNKDFYDPTKFAQAVSQQYGWAFTSEIAEEMIPRFLAKGWLKEGVDGSKTGKSSVYICSYERDKDASINWDEAKKASDEMLKELLEAFKAYVESLSPLLTQTWTDDERTEVLLQWLTTFESYSGHKKLTSKEVSGTLTVKPAQDTPDAGHHQIDDKAYLCASFVKHLFDTESPLCANVDKLAQVAFLIDVAQGFAYPEMKPDDKFDLTAYLDAPVAMALLGLSGKESAENANLMVKSLQTMNCPVKIFKHSCDEITDSLKAVLVKQPHERTGPTQAAILAGEVIEDYVRQVSRNPEEALKSKNVYVVPSDLTLFPSEHKFFSQESYEDFMSGITWQQDKGLRPRERDAQSMAAVVRKKQAIYNPDLFKSRAVFVTGNAKFYTYAKRFMDTLYSMYKEKVPSVILTRHLATALWLRCGFNSKESVALSRQALMAACERVLEINTSIVDEAKKKIAELQAIEPDQLDFLLSEPRSCKILMDKTLGVYGAIGDSPKNAEEILKAMRDSLAEDIQADADEKVKAAQDDFDKKSASKANELSTTKSELFRAKDLNGTAIASVRKRINKKRYFINQLIGFGYNGLMFVILALPLVSLYYSKNVVIYTSLQFAGAMLTAVLFRATVKDSLHAKLYGYVDNQILKHADKQLVDLFGDGILQNVKPIISQHGEVVFEQVDAATDKESQLSVKTNSESKQNSLF